jgi:dipeptidyl aminopeptidase/acylaminoacyl peptidase
MRQYNLQRTFSRAGITLLLTAALVVSADQAPTTRLFRDGLILDGVPAADAALLPRIDTYQQARGTRFLDWTADGKLLVAAYVGNDEQLQTIAGPLQAPLPLSAFGGNVRAATAQAYRNDLVALLKDEANGAPALYLLDVATQRERALLTANDRPESPLWAHDGQRLAFTSHLRNGNDADLYVLNTGSGTAQLLASGGEWRALDWSLDDRSLLALQRDTSGSAHLWRIDLATLALQALSAEAGEPIENSVPGKIYAALLAPDGRQLFVLGKRSGDHARVQLLALDGSGALDQSAVLTHDVEHFAVSADARFLAYDYNDSGYSHLSLSDRRSKADKPLQGLPPGVITALKFDRAGTRLAVNIERPQAPGEVYVLDTATGRADRWTQSTAATPASAAPVAPLLIRFRTLEPLATGRSELAALIYRPRTAPGPRQKRPVLIYLPPGDGQLRARFSARLQMLVNELGFAVVVPEMRSGDDADRAQWRDQQLHDIGALLVWTGAQSDLDRTRTAIMGNGDSSDLALAAQLNFADRLQRTVVVDGNPDAGGAQLLLRPVLIARGFQSPMMSIAQSELLLWRMRAANNAAWLLAATAAAPAPGKSARAELERVIAQFLLPVSSAASAAD